MEMEVLIDGEFALYKQKNFTCNVELTAKCLTYKSGSTCLADFKEETINIDDIIGCTCMKSKSVNNCNNAYFTVYAYPLFGKQKSKRFRKSVTFVVSTSNKFDENLDIANKWRATLYSVMYCSSSCITSEEGFPLQVPLYKKKSKNILVFINPKSGPGLAYEIYKLKVEPILLEAEICCEVIVTSHSNHAYDIILSKDLSIFAGIVIVSGDGLLYEVYNGLLQRSDRDITLSIPVGIIPGGSGNGLARSIAHHVKEPYLSNPVLISTLNIVNPVSTAMDLVLINSESGKNYISFLSIGYGLLSDIDIESEKLRALGEARFSIYALARILNLRKYRTRLSYKIAKGCSQYQLPTTSFKNRTILVKSRESDCRNLNENRSDTGLTNLSLSPDADTVSENNNFERPIFTEPSGALDKPLSSEWITIEDDFISIYAVPQAYIGSDKLMSPRSRMNDGLMWLCYLKGNFARASILKYLLAMTDGKHVNMPGSYYIPVTDLRIEPLCSEGVLTIDGELIDLCAIQATVLPGKGRVMTRRDLT